MRARLALLSGRFPYSPFQVFRLARQEGNATTFCMLYIFAEYVRPQAIYLWLSFAPWARIFLVSAALSFLLETKRNSKLGWPAMFVVLLAIQITASTLLAYNYDAAEKQYFDAVSWLLVYFILSSILVNAERLWVALYAFMLSCAKISIFCAYVWAARGFSFASWGVAGPPGYFQNSGELALLMAMVFCMSVSLCVSQKAALSKWRFRLLCLIPVSAAMTVLASSSRGSQLGFAVGMGWLFVSYRGLSFRNLITSAIVLVVTYLLLPAEQVERFVSSGSDETSVSRISYWNAAVDMLNRYPYFGVGHANFPVYYHDFLRDSGALRAGLEMAHNSYLQVGAELGYPGLLIFLLIIVASFSITRRVRGDAGAALRNG